MSSVPKIALDALQIYLGRGVARDPAIGIVSVLYAGESKLNTGPQPGSAGTDRGGVLYKDGAFGIASWNGDRQDALAKFAAKKKPGDSNYVNTLECQLLFVLTECANDYPSVWTAIQSYPCDQVIDIFVKQYERPANPQGEIARSLAFAKELDAASLLLQPLPPPIAVNPTQGQQVMNPLLLELLPVALQALGDILAVISKHAQAHAANPVQPAPVPAPSASAIPFDASEIATELGKVLIPLLTAAGNLKPPGAA